MVSVLGVFEAWNFAVRPLNRNTFIRVESVLMGLPLLCLWFCSHRREMMTQCKRTPAVGVPLTKCNPVNDVLSGQRYWLCVSYTLVINQLQMLCFYVKMNHFEEQNGFIKSPSFTSTQDGHLVWVFFLIRRQNGESNIRKSRQCLFGMSPDVPAFKMINLCNSYTVWVLAIYSA